MMKEFKGSKNWRCGNAESPHLANEGYDFISAEGGFHKEKTNRGFGIATFMCKEDKNLIVAAPDLLEALQDALHAFDKHGEHSEWDFARAAIAKALGETK